MDAGLFSKEHQPAINFGVSARGHSIYCFALLKTGCRISDTAKVLVRDGAVISIIADDHLCGMVTLATKPGNELSEIVWLGPSVNATTHSIQVKVSGRYRITAIDSNHCRVGDTLDVQVKACEPAHNQIHFPNAFTPNQDGKNDIFKPVTSGTIISYELTVYNKLGQRIFISHDPYSGWNGKIAGKAQSSSAYVWICRYQFQGRQVKFPRARYYWLDKKSHIAQLYSRFQKKLSQE